MDVFRNLTRQMKYGVSDPVLDETIRRKNFKQNVDYLVLKYSKEEEFYYRIKALAKAIDESPWEEFLDTKPKGEVAEIDCTFGDRTNKFIFTFDRAFELKFNYENFPIFLWILNIENKYKYKDLVNLIFTAIEINAIYYKRGSRLKALSQFNDQVQAALDKERINQLVKVEMYLPTFYMMLNLVSYSEDYP